MRAKEEANVNEADGRARCLLLMEASLKDLLTISKTV